MTYAVQQDLVDRYGTDELILLTDKADPPSGEIDATAVTRALTDTDSLINGYLATRMTTPLVTVPSVVVSYACAIARYKLSVDHASARASQDYEDAIAWLVNVAKGLVSLGDTTAPATPTAADTPSFTPPTRRFFTKRSLRDY